MGKLAWRIAAWVAAPIVLYVSAGVVLSLIPTRGKPADGPQDYRFYVSTNGVHTDFILPTKNVPDELVAQLGELGTYGYLAFGWGDKGFYLDTPTWSELRASTAVRAMLLPSPTAVHVSGYPAVGSEWKRVTISGAQLDRLIAHLEEAFTTTLAGEIVLIPDGGYGPADAFYEAEGSYNAFYTCNNWVNQGLKKMGIRTAVWSPSEWGIMRWL